VQLPSRKRLQLACCVAFIAVHSWALLGVSVRDTLWLLANSRTVLPRWRPGLSVTAPPSLQQLALVYLHSAGIERGYGFFAPNVPHRFDLAFDIYFPDGSVTHLSPNFAAGEDKLRWASATDYLGRLSSDQVREVLLKLIALSVHHQYPAAERMRVTLSKVRPPTVAEFRAGKRPVDEPAFTYEFAFSEPPPYAQRRNG
jgi:hypothetical protein